MPDNAGKTDLHLHSSASDGIYSPGELIRIAGEYALSSVALTDHETTGGIDEAWTAAREYGIELIPGVEISAGFHGREIHILGYFLTVENNMFQKVLRELRDGRFNRMDQVIGILGKMGIRIGWEEIKEESGPAAPGRLHLARILEKKGYVKSIKDAFELYLGKGKPAYIPRIKLEAARAIEILLASKVIPVLAHPGVTGETAVSIHELKEKGLMGIEVFHPEHTDGLTLNYKNIALKEGLLVTGGSDYHGDKKDSCPHPGCVSLDYHYLDILKERLNDISE